MIPKKLKYTMTITLLALGTACLATGCKKKHDKIDLSGNQAAESSVQTAPAATTVSGEGNSENKTGQEITIEPAIENAAGQSQGTSAGGSATAIFPVSQNRNLPERECFRSIPGHFGLLSKSRDQCAFERKCAFHPESL